MNEDAKLFKPEPVKVLLNDVEYSLVYDLNSFCEMEKMYDSVDDVLKMLLGSAEVPDLAAVKYQGNSVNANDITINEIPLAGYITKINQVKEAKHSDTLNLLWLGCIHEYAVHDNFGEIERYTLSKALLGAGVTFKNLREINSKILTAILRDLVPAEAVKNAEAPEKVEKKLVLHQ